MAARVSKEWKYNDSIKIDEFDLNTVNKDNLINQLLKITSEDITRSFMMKLFGTFKGKNFCHHYDTFTVPAKAFSFLDPKKNKYVSNKEPFVTTIGIWVFNVYFLRDLDFSHVFGGYINDNINKKKFDNINEKLVFALLEDNIDVERYKKFLDRTQFFMPFETILSPNNTERMLTCSKKIDAYKKKLIKENKEILDVGDARSADKAEEIEKKLLDFALEYLKDDPAIDLYLSGAGGTLGNNFKNMYLMRGALKDPDPNAKKQYNIATSSYINGISADEYTLIANSLAGGPYSRSKKTEFGGYLEKLLNNAFGSITIDGENTDCHTDKYLEFVLEPHLKSAVIYSYMIKSNGDLEELTSENIDKYVGKKIKIRWTGFCKSKTGVCHKCAGNFFYRRGTKNIGLATAQIPTVLKLRAMKSFHDSNVQMTEIDPMKIFNI